MKNPPINIDVSKSFLRMKTRGQDDTQIGMDVTPSITNLNKNQISNYLSKKEMMEYRPITFQYGYHRLSINDLSLDGSQPFEDPIVHKLIKYSDLRTRMKRKLLCNGEIYNYTELLEKYKFTDKDLQSNSDVEIIMPLYIRNYEKCKGDSNAAIVETLNEINGDYSFIIMENTTSFSLKDINVFIGRDPLGTRPLYMVKYIPKNPESNKNDLFYMFTSEIKGIPLHLLNDSEYVIQEVPPGTYWSFKNSIIDKNKNDFIVFHDFGRYKSLDACIIKKADPETITDLYNQTKLLLTNSIIDRYTLSNQNIGILLSGGFDSCIIVSILTKYLVEKCNYEKQLQVFTIGDPDNIDTNNAILHVQSLEKHYNIDIHHHIVQIDDVNLMIEEINTLIVQLETFDRKTIQKSLPMSFLLKYIQQNTDVKVLLSGEGLDELCGYDQLFLFDDSYFQQKSIELLENLSKYDLLRSDKIAGYYGLELRYPFLDMNFIDYFLKIHPMLKRPQISGYTNQPIEKYIIRKAFDTDKSIYIDKTILWSPRQDIRYSFNNYKTILSEYFNNLYTDLDFSNFVERLYLTGQKEIIPETKEEMHYKKIFDTYYPSTSHILQHYWKSIWNN